LQEIRWETRLEVRHLLDVSEGLVEVHLRRVGSQLGIPGGDRLHDEKVLGSGGG